MFRSCLLYISVNNVVLHALDFLQSFEYCRPRIIAANKKRYVRSGPLDRGSSSVPIKFFAALREQVSLHKGTRVLDLIQLPLGEIAPCVALPQS
jgi:hypothetical protein